MLSTNARRSAAILALGPTKPDSGLKAEHEPLPRLELRILAYALSALLLGSELWAIARPAEDFPWSSAPMFARYHTQGHPLYRISFLAEFADGRLVSIDPAQALGLGELSIKRLFFARYYGSTDEHHPQGHHHNDNERAFAARLADFSERALSVYARKMNRTPSALQIEVSEYLEGKRTQSKLVSRYDWATKKLERLSR